MRSASIERKTTETDIKLSLTLEGDGRSRIATGCGFLDHMLTLFAGHGRFDLILTCDGDVDVDYHHTVEDVGIVLGEAILKALGEARGICRYGSCLLPMDEALVMVALDISGRCYLSYDMPIGPHKVGDMDTELVQEFLLALCRRLKLTLHVKRLEGTNAHHIIEALFKALGRALRQATRIDPEAKGEIPSTKGAL